MQVSRNEKIRLTIPATVVILLFTMILSSGLPVPNETTYMSNPSNTSPNAMRYIGLIGSDRESGFTGRVVKVIYHCRKAPTLLLLGLAGEKRERLEIPVERFTMSDTVERRRGAA